jgi:hypothetical protein
MKQILKGTTHAAFKLVSGNARLTGIRIVAKGLSSDDKADIEQKVAFFLPSVKRIEYLDDFSPTLLTSGKAILYATPDEAPNWLRAHPGRFNINRHTCPMEGWSWIYAAAFVEDHQVDLAAARQRFANMMQALGPRQANSPCYVFGTGPSLAKAIERDWQDGSRIVCNTIVRDKELWDHLQPDFIVAGDGIYHFGFTEFAKAFRNDLKQRLQESPRTGFIYPAQFDVIVRRELGHLSAQLIPMPVGEHVNVHENFDTSFALPAMGNILNLLLLPVACNLSRNVGLWGFDGRAPNDKLFWSNSSKHSYGELLPTLQAAHPAFFDHNVPKEDPEKYIRMVHGDVLERCLSQAEADGWHFKMLHHSWTPTLAKRHA